MPTSLHRNSSWYYNNSLGIYVCVQELSTESGMGIDLLKRAIGKIVELFAPRFGHTDTNQQVPFGVRLAYPGAA